MSSRFGGDCRAHPEFDEWVVGPVRPFSRLKETRRLRDHRYRGLAKVQLHYLFAVLTLQAKALIQVKEGLPIREAMRKVA